MTKITLSWPPSTLSPNSRAHWAVVAADRRAYRREGWLAAKEVNAAVRASDSLCVTFHPPDKRRRDLDNMLASIKSGLDGIADATCKDDSGWSLTISVGEPVKGGKVVVEVAK